MDDSDRSESVNLTLNDDAPATTKLTRYNSEPVQRVKVSQDSDPLAQRVDDDIDSLPKSVNATLRSSDEARVASAMYEASKKRKTGSIYSVKVQMSETGTIGIGVKVLKNNIMAVSLLKREGGLPGTGEAAGIRLGDIVVGVNFRPCRDGVRTLLAVVREESSKGARTVQLQCWRCHQLCTDAVPGSLFPRADDVFVQGYTLFRSKVFNDWERWNFVEIMLRHMSDELDYRIASASSALSTGNSYPRIRAIHNQVLDLERNILQAKGLRTALCVRIVHTSFVEDAVVYVLRVEDVESGLQWIVRKRYRDFFSLHGDLVKMSQYTRDIPFPKKRLVSLRTSTRVIEERIVALEQFVRMAVHRLTHYSAMDAHASQSLRRLQQFLDVEEFVNCLHPPPLDDQRYLELMVYRHLNDFNSLSCQQCIRFVDSVDLDSLATEGPLGYQPVLDLLSQALSEVEEYTLQQFGQQMTHVLSDRRPGSSQDKIRVFVRRCVRRQVEAAVYLPLRRTVFRIVYSYIAAKAQKLQHAMKTLRGVPPSVFFVNSAVETAARLNDTMQAFRDLVGAFLPADQGHALMKAAAAVMELHSECSLKKSKTSDSSMQSGSNSDHNNQPAATNTANSGVEGVELKTSSATQNESSDSKSETSKQVQQPTRSRSLSDISSMADMMNKAVLADPAGTIFSAAEHALTDKRDFDDEPGIAQRESAVRLPERRFFGEKSAARYSGKDLRRGNQTSSADAPAVEPPSPAFSVQQESEGASKPSREVLLEGLLRASVDIRPTSSDEGDKVVAIRGSSKHEPNSCESITPAESEGSSIKSSGTRDNSGLTSSGGRRRGLSLSSAVLVNIDETPLGDDRPEDEIPDDYCVDGVEEDEHGGGSLGRDTIHSSVISEEINDGAASAGAFYEGTKNYTVVSADDFLPMFTYVLVQSDLPQLLLVKEVMSSLVDNEEMYGECGYYMATLEASVQHVLNLADDYNATLANAALLKQNSAVTSPPKWNEV